jgi:aminoglycoside phosphotransferase (APT) family kinase protein
VIVEGSRLYLLDFDLYCEGDPALDIGNFVGHITEHSLRTLGDPAALATAEAAIEERFVELSGLAARSAVRAYATLTLARHVHLSTLHADRRPYTGALIELCEERLGTTGRARARAGPTESG